MYFNILYGRNYLKLQGALSPHLILYMFYWYAANFS